MQLIDPNKNHKQSGFAMIEVLVTSVIFAIGVSGMGVLLLKTIQATQDNAQRSQGMWVVQDLVGRIRANPDGALLDSYSGSMKREDCEDQRPAAICSEHISPTFNNFSELPAANCSAVQMATFDIWSSVCGFDLPTTDPDDKTFDNSAEFIVEPELTSTCINPVGGGAPCFEYNINLEWNARITQGSSNAALRINKNTYSMNVELN